MGHLLLVNPKRRKARRNPKRRLSAKQIAAGFGGGGGRKRRKRRSHSRATLHTNPRKRRSGGRRKRRLHRNPRGAAGIMGKAKSFLSGQLMPAAFGAAGALAVDIGWALSPLPPSIKAGAAAPLIKIAGAVVLGAAVSKFANKQFGQAMVAGYLTVTAYDMIKKLVARTIPALPLSDYPYDLGYMQSGPFIPDENGVSAYLAGPEGYNLTEQDGVGAYMNGWGDDVS